MVSDISITELMKLFEGTEDIASTVEETPVVPETPKLKLRFKKLSPAAVVPKYSKPGDAGLDLTTTSYTPTDDYHEFGTGLAVEIPEGHVGLIFPRSSISNKDMYLSNAVGVVDSGFRGEVRFRFKVHSNKPDWRNEIYKVGDRVGQLIVMPYPQVETEEVEELSSTDRGESGFGSSGL